MIFTISNGVEDKQLEEIRQKTKEDATMQAVIDLVKRGWPVDKRAVPIPARPYFNVRDEIVIEGGVLYKGDRCVIPSALRTPPPLDLSFWSFLTFLHHGIEEVERHLL